MLALFLPALRQAEAGAEVSVDFFYDNIGSDGSWVEVADYGYCWQPSVAVSNSKWRPYSDGYWVYTDVGWTWVSNEDFGWATYHYGRWTRLRDRGWFWVPGREWGPAWVSWRTGGDHVGWAPLPPRGRGDVEYDRRSISGHVDVEFDIGPSYYNFVDVRYIGEPVLRERIVEPHLNVTYISRTVNVTNITYTNSVVYNHGPDYETVNRYSTRPIRRMSLERDTNADLSVSVRANGRARVQGDRLLVAGPLVFQKPAKPVAPKMVKEKIEKPTFERGWDGDPKAQAELKEKMKKEDPKTIPPPSFTPNANPAAPAGSAMPGAGASPAGSANPATTAAPAAASPAMTPDKDKDKGRDKNASPMPTAAAPVNPAFSPVTTPPGKAKKERDEKLDPAVTPATVPGVSPAPKREKPSDRQQSTPSSLTTSPDGTPFREPAMREKDVKKDKPSEKSPDMMPPTRQPSDEAKKEKPSEKAPDMKPPTRQPSDAATEKAPRKPKDDPTLAAPPQTREAPAEAPRKQPKEPMSAEPAAPPKREAPPEPPRKQPSAEMPKERTAPPPAPGANEPAKPEAPRSKQRPDKKADEPAPTPGG
jgi:hypothetical protein